MRQPGQKPAREPSLTYHVGNKVPSPDAVKLSARLEAEIHRLANVEAEWDQAVTDAEGEVKRAQAYLREMIANRSYARHDLAGARQRFREHEASLCGESTVQEQIVAARAEMRAHKAKHAGKVVSLLIHENGKNATWMSGNGACYRYLRGVRKNPVMFRRVARLGDTASIVGVGNPDSSYAFWELCGFISGGNVYCEVEKI